MSGASPLAAQSPSATRSFDPMRVAPSGTVTVTITGPSGGFGVMTVTETLPAGFTYVTSDLASAQVDVNGQDVQFVPVTANSFTYTVTASSTEADHTFSGTLNIAPGNSVLVGGQNTVTVSSGTPPPTPPDPEPTPGAGSIMANDQDDVNLYLTVSGQNDNNPNTKEITLTGGSDALFSGGGAAEKAYTAMTTEPSKVMLALVGGDYSSDSAPVGGAVSEWWDSLGDEGKRRVLKLDLNMQPNDGDSCDIDLCVTDAGEVGFDGDETIRDYAAATPADRLRITQAFHWDLLSGLEMYKAAEANGLPSPGNYMKAFRDLTIAERANVERLYAADTGILRRGDGTSIMATAGSGMTDLNDDRRADNVGSSMVVVKVAGREGPDTTGANPEHAVGNTFNVRVMYHPLPLIGDNTTLMPADGSVVISPDGSMITISGDDTGDAIATVTADVTRAVYQQLINYSLKDGSGLPYAIDGDLGAKNTAMLVKKAGQSTTEDKMFTIVVNEEGRSANRSETEVTVRVASGNMPPVFDAAALDAATAGVTILEFMAGRVPVTVGLPINFGAHASDSDNQVLEYSIEPRNKGLKIDPNDGMVMYDSGRGVAYAGNEDGIEYTVTVSDGTKKATYSFTAAIATNKPMANPNADDGNDAVTDIDVTDDGTATVEITVGSPDVGVPQDGRNVPVVNLLDLLHEVHQVSALDIAIVAPTGLPFTLDGTELQLASVPEAKRDGYVLSYTGDKAVKIEIDDGYDPQGTSKDLTLTLEITVHVAEPPTVGAKSVSISIEEDWDGKLPGTVALYDPKGSGVTPFYHYAAGTGSGEIDETGSDFEVNPTSGEVTLLVEQDFETEPNRHTLTIFVRDEDDVGAILSVIGITVDEIDVNEPPMIAVDAPTSASIPETGKPDRPAMVGDDELVIAASDEDAADTGANYSISPSDAPFAISANGAITASGAMESGQVYELTITATDKRDSSLTDTHMVTITVDDVNEPPMFTNPRGEELTISIPEDHPYNSGVENRITVFAATDPDAGETLKFSIRDEADRTYFEIGEDSGVLTLVKKLDFETKTELEAHVVVTDHAGLSDRVKLIVNVGDVNDNAPMFATDSPVTIMVVENAPRGTALTSAIAPDGVYAATDDDGTAPNNTVTYSIDHKSFHIDSNTGMLTVLESLDFDSGTPCGATGCQFKITAMDGGDPSMTDTLDVTVTVMDAQDSVSTFKISKANPVPGVSMGDADSALADTKEGMYGIPERPSDQPATNGSAPVNFVEADWASWDTVLRIEVTAQSPDAACGMNVANQNNNQCVYIDVESDSAGNELRLAAYRSTIEENRFIAAVKVVENDPTDDGDGDPGERNKNNPVYMDAAGGVVRLEVDEEDEVIFRLVGSTAPPISVDIENEYPEFSNFMPEHEAAFADGDVEYTFTVTDPVSGIPEPEDLAGDIDGDGDYMPLVAIISNSQCHSEDPATLNPPLKGYTKVDDEDTAGNDLWCMSAPTVRQVVDDRDFDEIDDGFEVATKIVLDENVVRYVTFIVCDNAGNCAMYTPDENDTDEALAEITIDTEDPVLVEARTGIKWDSIDEELDDNNKTWIQVIFEDLSALDEDTVENDDFVVEGHTVKDVRTYGDDADVGSGEKTRRMVFVELEDELAPDETPDVTLVPNGIADKAGNEQDDGDVEAKDYIAPSFTVVSIVAPRTPEGSSDQLAGDDDEVVITVTSDERIVETRPSVTVSYVNAPSGSVYTKVGTADTCDDKGTDDGKRVRGEIVNSDNCKDSDAADGSALGTTIQKISNTEWIVTVDEPESTGYYNIYISGHDRSPQRNEGEEGVKPADIVTDFFERDGDLNSDDAHFFQGDVNLSNPGVRVSGVQVEDTEPTVEFKSPLFVELDFTKPYISDCASDVSDDERDVNCYAESDEYAKDGFDSVTVTSFTLNGTDITDSVKTTDDETFLVSIEGIALGDHEIEIQAMDQAGNALDKALSIEFEVEERDAFSKRLSPGWNLVSLPGEPADSDISVVFGSDVEVRTVYTYDPIIPGGWMVAVRESLDSDWQGDLTEITARRGYWVLSDAIQDWEVSIPRLAGGAVGTGTPIQPPVIALYAGWNLVPVVDVRGNALDDKKAIRADVYLNNLDDGLDLARVLGFDTITNQWSTVMDPDVDAVGSLSIGSAYWVFVREAASLVPGGLAE